MGSQAVQLLRVLQLHYWVAAERDVIPLLREKHVRPFGIMDIPVWCQRYQSRVRLEISRESYGKRKTRRPAHNSIIYSLFSDFDSDSSLKPLLRKRICA